MRRRLLAVLTTATALSLVAGCGDAVDKNAYVKDVTSVQQSMQTEVREISDELAKVKTRAAFSTKLDEFATTVDTSADRIAAVEPPADVADLHEEYVELLRGYSKSLELLAARIKTANAEEISDISKDLGKLSSELATEEQQLFDKVNTALKN